MTKLSRLFILCAMIQGSVWAASYYVDPVNGDIGAIEYKPQTGQRDE